MAINITCSCNTRLEAKYDDAGKRAKCSVCGHVLIIPAIIEPDRQGPPPLPQGDWFYSRSGERMGPVSFPDLRRIASSGGLKWYDLVWKAGMQDWQPASTVMGTGYGPAEQAGRGTNEARGEPRDAEAPRAHVLLDKGGVNVSTARFLVPNQTFPMGGITAVRFERRDRIGSSLLIMVLGVLGGLLIVAGVLSFYEPSGEAIKHITLISTGIVLCYVTWRIRWMGESDYAIILTTSSGEMEAYLSKDGQLASEIVDAINRAIVATR